MYSIAQLLAQRDDAALRGDRNLVREYTAFLARLGYEAEPTAAVIQKATPKRTRRKAS